MTKPLPLVKLITDEQVQGQAKELFENLTKSLGQVPKWVRVMANTPDILVGFFTMFKATMDDAPADKKLKWKVAYKVSDLNKCEFCVNVATLQLKQLGLGDEEIKTIDKAENDKEILALQYAQNVTEQAYKIDPELFAKIKKKFSDEEIVEITAVVGLFNYINRFNDALRILPDVE